MKKAIFCSIFCLLAGYIQAQPFMGFAEESMNIQRSSSQSVIIEIPIRIARITGNIILHPVIYANADPSSYQLLTPALNIAEDDTVATVKVLVKKGKTLAKEDKVYIGFTDTYLNGKNMVLLNICNASANASASEGAGSIAKDIVLLNGYNFEFGDTRIQNKYVGHLNLFAPRIEGTRWGFNTGIMNINYAVGDSSGSERATYVIENVQISPLDQLSTGSRYLKQFNRYSTQTKFSTWSFYVQPLFELTSRKSRARIFLHLHLELLASRYGVTTTMVNKQTDTMLYNAALPVYVKTMVELQVSANRAFLSGYFGTGVIFDLAPWENGRFVFQPIIGFNTASVAFETPVMKGEESPARRLTIAHKFLGFYLVRSSYHHKISNNSSAIIGIDIRGNLPQYSPSYAAYAGVNIGLEKLFELFK